MFLSVEGCIILDMKSHWRLDNRGLFQIKDMVGLTFHVTHDVHGIQQGFQ